VDQSFLLGHEEGGKDLTHYQGRLILCHLVLARVVQDPFEDWDALVRLGEDEDLVTFFGLHFTLGIGSRHLVVDFLLRATHIIISQLVYRIMMEQILDNAQLLVHLGMNSKVFIISTCIGIIV
jgi:hypothetical protein